MGAQICPFSTMLLFHCPRFQTCNSYPFSMKALMSSGEEVINLLQAKMDSVDI